MLINKNRAHLTYCSNIHPGESWEDTFSNLKKYTTEVRDGLTSESFGIGLRLSNEASLGILKENRLMEFKSWLESENLYVFTINGFPYGGFHNQKVKDQVHAPDWTTNDRLNYTKRLFDILSFLLPEGMDGGVSTSPISYRYWHEDDIGFDKVKTEATENLSELLRHLHLIKEDTGKSLHLDMEPEPDGILETTNEFVDFFNDYLLTSGCESIQNKLNIPTGQAKSLIREHFQLCYDVCHFAVGFENPKDAIDNVINHDIKVGRIQISAALGSGPRCSPNVKEKLKVFDEPVYLHQAVVKNKIGSLESFSDLDKALMKLDPEKHDEIRTHFHVPIFMHEYGELVSTQDDIVETLKIWSKLNFTNHLEVETYTWDVLPDDMKTDIVSSIVRELNWVVNTLD